MTRSPTSAPPTRAVGWLSVVGAVGSALLAVGHTGLHVPLLSALGPEGTDAVWPAAVAFAVATLVYATVAAGVFRARAWAWPLATAVHALAVLGGVLQFRGAASAIGIAVSLTAVGLLLTPTVRHDLLGGRSVVIARRGPAAPTRRADRP